MDPDTKQFMDKMLKTIRLDKAILENNGKKKNIEAVKAGIAVNFEAPIDKLEFFLNPEKHNSDKHKFGAMHCINSETINKKSLRINKHDSCEESEKEESNDADSELTSYCNDDLAGKYGPNQESHVVAGKENIAGGLTAGELKFFYFVEKEIKLLMDDPDTFSDSGEMHKQRRQAWTQIAKLHVPRVYKMLKDKYHTIKINKKKIAAICCREYRRAVSKTSKTNPILKGKRITKELISYFKNSARKSKTEKKKSDKGEIEKKKKEIEQKEAQRQARKLNFLLNQTELFTHFILNKHEMAEIDDNVKFDIENEKLDAMAAKSRAMKAVQDELARKTEFERINNENIKPKTDINLNENKVTILNNQNPNKIENAFQNCPDTSEVQEDEKSFLKVNQPSILKCTLKEYQLKGLSWLINLYNQGINGILADDMGLGKTVQAISFLSYLAEEENLWGPFLVVTPASTLHNWCQEFEKFLPSFKVLSYWGTINERKKMRKNWKLNTIGSIDSEVHVVITSYQIAVADEKIFQKIKWQYMVLDEAQAIKSSQSLRWKTLLSFKCRNRLLLTGTPIQNNMQELWALLHFIMPTLFDSHDEFNDWFSRDIESSAITKKRVDERQLQKLHLILKPFMLRREKGDVKNEIGIKTEKIIYCELSHRQKMLYKAIGEKIPIDELLEKKNFHDIEENEGLMNLCMQFRKVCNHPDLFEKLEVESSFSMAPRNFVLRNRFFMQNKIANESSKRLFQFKNFSENEKDIRLCNSIEYNFNKKCNFQSFTNNEVFGFHNIDNTRRIQNFKTPSSSQRLLNIRKIEQIAENQHLEFSRKKKNRHDNNCNIKRVKINYEKINEDKLNDYGKDTSYNYNITNEDISENKNPNLSRFSTKRKIESFIHRIIRQNPCKRNGIPKFIREKINILPYLIKNQQIYHSLHKFQFCSIPPLDRFVSDSGKLATLDLLLPELQKKGNRILMYFQMTKMIDLIEEYLVKKGYTYLRLDGSSRISARRDMVHDWQNNNKFIFLLSTRAGGLGINLTAADTVIFYDSDWNPTVDQQAMDRAHRLGQTKDVTVYRLITKNTIEEKVMEMAQRKGEMQKMIIECGEFTGKHIK